MEDVFKKISNYSFTVEHDLESLIFLLLNLIDTKTRTLKKLLKLHLQVKSIRKATDSKFMEHLQSQEYLSRSKLPKLLEDSIDELTFTENSQYRNEISELKGVSESFCVSQNSSVEECVQTNHKLEVDSQPEANSNPVDEDMLSKTENVDLREFCEKKYDVSRVPVFSANQLTCRDCSTSTNALNTEELQKDGSTKSTQFESLDSESVKTVIPPPSNCKIDNHINEVNDNYSSTSSTDSYCVVSHLQGVLSTLQECLPGDSGFYIETSSYKDVLNILEKLVISCGIASRGEPSRTRAIHMNKCSTQPTLKTTYEEMPKRMISSSTECSKICKKKIRV